MIKSLVTNLIGKYVRGYVHRCPCGQLFIGAKNAKYHSEACRKKVERSK